MARAELLLLVATTLSCLGGAWTTCKGSTKIECRTKGQCIRLEHVCNGGRDCTDNSDEDPELCKIWAFSRGNCSHSRVSCNGKCYSFLRFCRDPECSFQLSSRVCQMVKEKKFNVAQEEPVPTPFPFEETMSEMIEEEVPPPSSLQIMSFMFGAEDFSEEVVNATEPDDTSTCPSLYTRVGTRCLALFTPAKVAWPEARQFCKSIHGDLVDFEDVIGFADLLRYLRDTRLTTDFWIGGRYHSETMAWAWASDDTPMPLGSPYWAERLKISCVSQVPSSGFMPPTTVISGSQCYEQAPQTQARGWCSAMTFEHHYYITDEECQSKRSPLCVLTRTPRDSKYLQEVTRP